MHIIYISLLYLFVAIMTCQTVTTSVQRTKIGVDVYQKFYLYYTGPFPNGVD